MGSHNRTTFNHWTVILTLLIISILLQRQVQICTDTARLIQLAQGLLNHEHYYKDFFDTNTPMALFLYFPAIFIAHLFSLKLVTALIIYVYTAGCFSLWLIQRLLQQSHTSNPLSALLLIASTISFLILPADAFSQREHFMILFVFPYLIEAGLRLHHPQKFSTKISISIGFLAGIAFAIKPYFMMLFFITEGLLCIKQKKCTSCFRLEVLIILAIQIAYLYTVFIFTPEYFFWIIPMAIQIYYLITASAGINISLTKIVAMISLLTLCIQVASMSKIDEIKSLRTLLAANLVGCLIIALLQRNNWYYHVFPAFAIAFVLLCLLINEPIVLFKKTYRHAIKDYPQIIYCFLACLLVTASIFLALSRYWDNIQDKRITDPSTQQLIQFIQENAPHQTVFFFGAAKNAYPMNIETSIKSYALSNYFFSPVQRTILRRHHLEQTVLDFWVHQTTHLLQKKKPDLVFIVTRPTKDYGEKKQIPYIQIFSQNKDFKKLWEHYRYKQHFQDFDVYQYNKQTVLLTPYPLALYNHLTDVTARTASKNKLSPTDEKPFRLANNSQPVLITAPSFLSNNSKQSSALQFKAVPYMKLFLQPDTPTIANNQNDASQYVTKFWEDYKLINKVNGFALYFSVHD